MTLSRLQRVKNAKETARCKWMLVVIQLFNVAVSDFDAKKSAHYVILFYHEMYIEWKMKASKLLTGFPPIREIREFRENFEDFFQSGKSGKNRGFQPKSGKKIQIRELFSKPFSNHLNL